MEWLRRHLFLLIPASLPELRNRAHASKAAKEIHPMACGLRPWHPPAQLGWAERCGFSVPLARDRVMVVASRADFPFL
ncbi:hypothetical protein E2562_038213 [Oryza meyeriana var. granulata]|uniref:Uncharacterized protein n=1 Tax=Oryza meyeriana var. granulata TaxID=110450 RepID=A0A6G1FGH7_9ORYZ|nr:hypothetical protein E2562_038213 [Oryza meyeriana var. granulata]